MKRARSDGSTEEEHQKSAKADKETSPKISKKPKVQIVLLDIEGTTTPISFVHDVLFPYAREHVKEHIEKKWDTEELQADVEECRKQAEEDIAAKFDEKTKPIPSKHSKKEEIISATVEYINLQMDKDRKIGCLKQLQGHIWLTAYQSGTLKGQVYDDVPPAFNKWTEAGVPIYIYSSGSIAAQKQLFGYSDKGDMLPQIKGHFDTTTGLKVEEESYKKIAKEITGEESGAENILFITDNIEEAKASTAIGMGTLLSVRPGTKELPKDHGVALEIKSFAEIFDHFVFEKPE